MMSSALGAFVPLTEPNPVRYKSGFGNSGRPPAGVTRAGHLSKQKDRGIGCPEPLTSHD